MSNLCIAKVVHGVEKEELVAANCKLQEQAEHAAECASVLAADLDAALREQRQVRVGRVCSARCHLPSTGH